MQTKTLKSGHVVMVDDTDAHYLERAIRVLRNRRDGRAEKNYAMLGDGTLLHRHISQAPAGVLVDHIDGNGMNNQRSNLRLCTRSENARNRGKQRDNTSGFKGVYRYKKTDRWLARVKIHQLTHNFGVWDTREEAAEAARLGRLALHGEFAAD